MSIVNIHAKALSSGAALSAESCATLEGRIALLTARFDRLADLLKRRTVESTVTTPSPSGPPPRAALPPAASLAPCDRDTPAVAALRAKCRELGLQTAEFKWVPSEYYSQPLEWRRRQLGAATVQQLCKSIVLENTHCVNADCSDRRNSRYYVVVFQYVERFDSEKLMRFVKGMNEDLGKKKFNFRVCETGESLTGFENNAIPPFGLKTTIPIILSKGVGSLGQFWMGGGDIDCKLRMDTAEFISVFDPFVVDCTIPIPAEDIVRM